jgi:hypothetical protein
MKTYKDGFHRIAGYMVIIEGGYIGRVCVDEGKGVWCVPYIPGKYGGWDNAYLQLTPDAFRARLKRDTIQLA